MHKILVLGDDTRSFLAITRSLGRRGLEVHAAPFNFSAPALKSRYITAIHRLPYFLGDGHEWLYSLKDLITSQQYDLLIPCDERALLPLHWHREEIEEMTRLGIPSPNAMDILFDKHKTRELARSLDIPIAPGRPITKDDTAEKIIAESGLPVAIKPTVSYGENQLYSRNKVIIARDAAELRSTLQNAFDQPHYFESFFPGQGIGVSVLAHEGHILQVFEHHRVHEFGGTSHYRVSAPLSPELRDATYKLMQEVRYTGIAMVEFRRNHASGEWILLEINARPWGSLPLPVAIGIDIPFRWYQLLINHTQTAAQDYPAGIYGRNLIPDTHFLRSQIRSNLRRPAKLARDLMNASREYLRIFTGREFYDVLVRDDPAPGWQEIRDALKQLRTRLTPAKLHLRQRKDYRTVQNTLKDSTGEIAIVCQGNICRSPFAAQLLERRLNHGAEQTIKVASYGNLPRQGNTSPENAVLCAQDYDIDLSKHRSNHFSQDSAENALLIIVFDEINLRCIRERYPHLQTPIVLLGSFSTVSRIISDPNGKSLDEFRSTYRIIAASIDGLTTCIRQLSIYG